MKANACVSFDLHWSNLQNAMQDEKQSLNVTLSWKAFVCKGNENLILQRKCSSAAGMLARRLKQLSIDQIFAFSSLFFIVCICNLVCSCRHMALYIHTHPHARKHCPAAPSIFISPDTLYCECVCVGGGVGCSSADGTCPIKSSKGQGPQCKGHALVTMVTSFSGETFPPEWGY